MYTITSDFATAMESNIKSLCSWIKYKDNNDDYVILTDSDALVSLKMSSEGELGSSSMRKIEVEFLKIKLPDSFYEININEYFEAIYGVLIDEYTETWSRISFGNFKITEIKNIEDSDTITWVGYDRMYDTIVDYVEKAPNPDYWSTTRTLSDYLTKVLSLCNMELGNTDFVNNDIVIDSDRFVSWVDPEGDVAGHWVSNSYGYKVRDLINDVCKISGTVAIISNDDKLYFKKLNPLSSVYDIATNSLISYKVSERYGNINKVILAREPQGDYSVNDSYEDLIEDYGVVEWKVDNNQLVDYQPIIEPDKLLKYDPEDPSTFPIPPQDNRERYFYPLFDAVCGTEPDGSLGIYYYPFEAETIGYGWFEIGDKIKIGDIYTLVLGYSLTLDGGINEKISARKTNITDTKFKYTSKKAENQTQLVVDKQNQVIRGYVEKNSALTKEISEITQTENTWKASFYEQGGTNLLKNSVMYAYKTENGIQIPEDWTVVNGELVIAGIGNLSKSGNAFGINGGSVYQKAIILTKPDMVYSFGFKYSKEIGNASYKVEWDENSEIVSLTSNQITTYTEEIYSKKIITNGSNIKITFSCDAGVYLALTDVMLCEGNLRDWSQYQNEITNGSVTLTGQGIRISGKGGLETTITDSSLTSKNKSGEILFNLDSIKTKVRQLEAYDLSMPPIKIINTGTAWAFVSTPITEGIVI